jgi:hypothetical protein
VAPARPRGVFTIPERYRSGLLAIAGLSDESYGELGSALERAPAFENAKELATWIGPEAKSISPTNNSQIIEALTSLYRLRVLLEQSGERVAKDVTAAMRVDDPSITNEAEVVIVNRLTKLLGMESLNILETKVRELKAEYEHGFCEVRILTDVRPVFGKNVTDPPSTMLLAHVLKLGYHDAHEGRHREFYVSLDTSDLAVLKAAIKRAEDKAQSLKIRFESAGLRIID